MSRSVIFNTLVVLAVTIQVRSQYIDFFQSFNTFLQPYQTTRRPNVVTKRPTVKQANKQNYQDAIFFETDDFMKQRQSTANPYITTSKPRRKTKTTRKPTTRSPWYQYNTESNTKKDNLNYYDNQINNGNINNVYNYDTSTKDYNRQTTLRPIFNNFGVTQKPTSKPRRTTVNPLLYRPGVRPAVVDDNRPPITNKPVTRPYDRPVTDRPGNDNSEAEIEIGPNEDDMSETEKRRFIEIAEQKCEEYKAMNTKKIVALPLATLHDTHGVELDVPTCAATNIPLIIGGKIVSIKEFPHMSLVGWKNIQKEGYSWKCGGSLISEQYILTAGHCTYHEKDYNVISGPPAAVQLGASYIDGRDAVVVRISSVIRHPKYKLRRSYHDVALIKLVTTVTFSESISPACLGVPPPIGDSIIATGWGRTEFGGDASKELRSVSVPIWGMDECREVWGTSLRLPEGPSATSQLCAGERKGGKDTCQGDSGGPAQVQDGCAWRIVAVTSVGRSCGAAETPALYAKIPRAFIAAQVFSNVKLNVQNNHNGNNNQHNVNNNPSIGNNWGNNGFDQAASNNQNNGNNNQNNANNNWGNNGYNQAGTNNQNGDRDEVNRPGNHQTISNVWGVTDNKFGNHGSNTDVIRTGSPQSPNNRDESINRPGNHQTIDTRKDTVNNYFVTSHTTGNTRQPVVSRPGNHQTIDNSNRDTNTGNNYFVTSHTSGNQGGVVSRPGNHQTIGNNYNSDTGSNNRYSDTQNTESNHDEVYDTTHRNNDDNSGHNYNNNYEDNVRNTNTWAANNARPEAYNNQYNDQNSYYNEQNNRNPQPAYSSNGAQNEYGTTENNAYNRNNNGYNGNNNREFAVANRPWWNR